MVDEMSRATVAATPTIGSTVVREAFDSGFTLYFSDHNSLSVSGNFVFRASDGTSSTLTASPLGLTAHTSTLVSLIGMEISTIGTDDADSIALGFTSGIALVVPRSGKP